MKRLMKQTVLPLLLVFFSSIVIAQDHCSKLDSLNTFNKLSGKPLANKYGNVKAVKFIYDIENDGLYFINASKYKNHFDFSLKELGYKNGMGNFLKDNYSSTEKRKFLLANLNYFSALDKYVVELSPTDLMKPGLIRKVYNLALDSTFVLNEKLAFILNSPRLNQLTDSLKNINTITPSEIYGQLSYQAVSKYKNYGKLKIIKSLKDKNASFGPNDILVLKEIPNYLPPVAGVIVTEFQTPLSHLSILGLNRKIPICAYTKAFENNMILGLNGKNVSLKVEADTFFLKVDSIVNKEKKLSKITLQLDLSADSLIDIKYMDKNSASIIGSKAANFGELHKVSHKANFKTPENAFAIPFYFYEKHLKRAHARGLVKKVATKTFDDNDKLIKSLAKIRKKIKKTSVNKKLIEAINAKITSKQIDYLSYRFRSSTNAEDIEGFSGAGLYTSKTGKLNGKKKTFEKAIKKVWASNWTLKAYSERKYYNIDQSKVAMGILVHRSFPSEEVNGVAITKNIYRKNSHGFLVNAQLGNENVVDPKKGVVCDQFLCFPERKKNDEKKTVIDVITSSNLSDKPLLMSQNEIQNLANQLQIIKKHYHGHLKTWSYTRVGQDIEFKLDGKDRQLYIKQVRPYND